jgi:hypothetical protein
VDGWVGCACIWVHLRKLRRYIVHAGGWTGESLHMWQCAGSHPAEPLAAAAERPVRAPHSRDLHAAHRCTHSVRSVGMPPHLIDVEAHGEGRVDGCVQQQGVDLGAQVVAEARGQLRPRPRAQRQRERGADVLAAVPAAGGR